MRLDALKEAPYAFGSTYEREKERPEHAWRQTLVDRTRFVAEVEAVVAGTVSGGDSDVAAAAAMTAMWVDPRFRRRGIGDLLVKTVVDWAAAAGYDEMLLWVADRNRNAERLYERNGFQRTRAAQEMRPGTLEFEMVRRLR